MPIYWCKQPLPIKHRMKFTKRDSREVEQITKKIDN
jgi:hypothetical protein